MEKVNGNTAKVMQENTILLKNFVYYRKYIFLCSFSVVNIKVILWDNIQALEICLSSSFQS